MIKHKKSFFRLLSTLLLLCVLCTVTALTAFAEGEDEAVQPDAAVVGQDQAADSAAEEPPAQPQPQEEAPDVSGQGDDQQEQTEEQRDPMVEYIYGYQEDADSSYEEPLYLDELPEAQAGEVVEATAVVIPNVAVSDASMFSGIVMWLCVALGIAVLVGVLVSKRTLRRGL